MKLVSNISNIIVSNISNIIAILTFSFSVFQWLYFRKIKFYVFVNKYFKKYKEVTLDVSFTYKIPKNIEVFKISEDTIKNIYKLKRVKKEINLNNHKMYNLDEYFIKIQLDTELNSDELTDELYISIPKLKSTYQSATRIIEELDYLSKELSKALNITDELYSLKIKYKNKNPFIGFALQHFGKDAVKDFICNVNCGVFMSKEDNILKDKTASIYKNYLNITDNNFTHIRRISQYLLLLK